MSLNNKSWSGSIIGISADILTLRQPLEHTHSHIHLYQGGPLPLLQRPLAHLAPRARRRIATVLVLGGRAGRYAGGARRLVHGRARVGGGGAVRPRHCRGRQWSWAK